MPDFNVNLQQLQTNYQAAEARLKQNPNDPAAKKAKEEAEEALKDYYRYKDMPQGDSFTIRRGITNGTDTVWQDITIPYSKEVVQKESVAPTEAAEDTPQAQEDAAARTRSSAANDRATMEATLAKISSNLQTMMDNVDIQLANRKKLEDALADAQDKLEKAKGKEPQEKLDERQKQIDDLKGRLEAMPKMTDEDAAKIKAELQKVKDAFDAGNYDEAINLAQALQKQPGFEDNQTLKSIAQLKQDSHFTGLIDPEASFVRDNSVQNGENNRAIMRGLAGHNEKTEVIGGELSYIEYDKVDPQTGQVTHVREQVDKAKMKEFDAALDAAKKEYKAAKKAYEKNPTPENLQAKEKAAEKLENAQQLRDRARAANRIYNGGAASHGVRKAANRDIKNRSNVAAAGGVQVYLSEQQAKQAIAKGVDPAAGLKQEIKDLEADLKAAKEQKEAFRNGILNANYESLVKEYEAAKAKNDTAKIQELETKLKGMDPQLEEFIELDKEVDALESQLAYAKEFLKDNKYGIVLKERESKGLMSLVTNLTKNTQMMQKEYDDAVKSGDKAKIEQAKANLDQAKFYEREAAKIFKQNADGSYDYSQIVDTRALQNVIYAFTGADARLNLEDEVEGLSKMMGMSKTNTRKFVKKLGFGREHDIGQRLKNAGIAAGSALALSWLSGAFKKHTASASDSAVDEKTITYEETKLIEHPATEASTVTKSVLDPDGTYRTVIEEIAAKPAWTEVVKTTVQETVIAEANAMAKATATGVLGKLGIPVAGPIGAAVIAGVTAFLLTKGKTEHAFRGKDVDKVLQDLSLVRHGDNKAIVSQIIGMQITGDAQLDKEIKAAVIKSCIGQGGASEANTEELMVALESLKVIRNNKEKMLNAETEIKVDKPEDVVPDEPADEITIPDVTEEVECEVKVEGEDGKVEFTPYRPTGNGREGEMLYDVVASKYGLTDRNQIKAAIRYIREFNGMNASGRGANGATQIPHPQGYDAGTFLFPNKLPDDVVAGGATFDVNATVPKKPYHIGGRGESVAGVTPGANGRWYVVHNHGGQTTRTEYPNRQQAQDAADRLNAQGHGRRH